MVYGKLVQDGREIWVAGGARPGGMFRLFIVEKKAMAQDVVADAAAFSTTSRRPATSPSRASTSTPPRRCQARVDAGPGRGGEAAAADPALKLWVVGHTDSVGAIDANMQLSQARAEAVVAALTSATGSPRSA